MEKLKLYGQEIEEQMKNLYQSLSEKDQRRYAAIESKKLGYGGISYICRLVGCDQSSVKNGLSGHMRALQFFRCRTCNLNFQFHRPPVHVFPINLTP